MFGFAVGPTRIYAYEARQPLGGQLVVDQLRLAHRYRNALVEQERKRREQVEAVLPRHFPNLVEVEKQILEREDAIEAVRSEIRRRNADSRRKTGTPEEQARIRGLIDELKELRGRRRELRQRAFGPAELSAIRKQIVDFKARMSRNDTDESDETEAVSDVPAALTGLEEQLEQVRRQWHRDVPGAQAMEVDLSQIETQDNEARKVLRANCGLYWGTYLTVEQGMKAARKGAPPKFHCWTGEGKLAVQLQGGLTVVEACSCLDSRLRIESLPEGTWDEGQPRSKRRTVAWLRIGSTGPGGREPVWAKIPFYFHRPMPTDAIIKWAYLVRRKLGAHYEYALDFVLERKAGWAREGLAKSGTVGIDLGWRLLKDGLRVAVWHGDDDRSGEVVIPRDKLSSWSKVEDLQSIRDQLFDGVRETLACWLGGEDVATDWLWKRLDWLRLQSDNDHIRAELAAMASLLDSPPRTIEVPAWLVERSQHLRLWRSTAKLAGLVLQWRESRFAGDELIFPCLEAWRKRDKHLLEWQENQRRNNHRWRECLYRRFAADLSYQYHAVVIEDTDWRDLQVNLPVEETSSTAGVKEYQRVAAVSRLVKCLRERMPKLIEVPAENTTKTCAHCEALCEFDAAGSLTHCCEYCGAVWDQDHNAANVILDRGLQANDEEV